MSFVFSYISWHYSKAFKNIFGIFSNFYWATYRFFSIPLLLKTFFSPWRRLDSSYTKQFDPGEFFGTIVVNTIMRFVGMFIRLIVILVGIFCLVALFIFEIIFFVLWVVLPAVIVWLIYVGIKTL